MATPEEINQTNETGDFEARLKKLENEWQLALDNLLWPALIGPGRLRFGANKDQLDNFGMQIATAGANTEAIFFVYQLVNDPTAETTVSLLQGFANPTGFAGSPWSSLKHISQAGTTIATIQTQVEAFGADTAGVSLIGVAGATTASMILTAADDQADGSVEISNAILVLGYFTSAPTGYTGTLPDGAVWYDTGTDKFYGRANGVTIDLGSAGTVITNQTGTYSAVVGDFVRCSGTFTVTLPSAPAVNSEVWVKNAGTGTITVARGGSDTMFEFTSGLTTVTLAPGEARGFKYYASGTEWQVF